MTKFCPMFAKYSLKELRICCRSVIHVGFELRFLVDDLKCL